MSEGSEAQCTQRGPTAWWLSLPRLSSHTEAASTGPAAPPPQAASHTPRSLLLGPPQLPIIPVCGSGLPQPLWIQPHGPGLLSSRCLTLTSNPKMAAHCQHGPRSGHVSSPLDCELLQRDLGHCRVESPALFIV